MFLAIESANTCYNVDALGSMLSERKPVLTSSPVLYAPTLRNVQNRQ